MSEMPEPVSIIGHGPVMNFTAVQPALKKKPHGSIKCYAEDDVLAALAAARAEGMREAARIKWMVSVNFDDCTVTATVNGAEVALRKATNRDEAQAFYLGACAGIEAILAAIPKAEETGR